MNSSPSVFPQTESLSVLSLYEDKLKFYFVQNGAGDEESEAIKFAREKLLENICASSVNNISEESCRREASAFNMKDILIFDKFEGDTFQAVSGSNALVLGPQCVINCFMNNITLPNIPSPIFSLPMRGMVVTLSSFSLEEKLELKKLINYMGGRFICTLTEYTTHLVTDSVRSKKYEVATRKGLKIMKSDWIHDVWNLNKTENIPAAHERFDIHKVPTFFNLKITTTGLITKAKKIIRELVMKNGGKYYGDFTSGINILIAKRDSAETPKLKAALAANIECLAVEWILDSDASGFALPSEEYRISAQTKSPAINNNDLPAVEARVSPQRPNAGLSVNRGNSLGNVDLSFKEACGKLNVQDVQKGGNFLVGCNIFVCGFASNEKEKICRILKAAGATQFDTINSQLTHVLIGQPSADDLSMLSSVQPNIRLVQINWLVQSIEQKAAVTDYEHVLYRKLNELPIEDMPPPANNRDTVPAPSASSLVDYISSDKRKRLIDEEAAMPSKVSKVIEPLNEQRVDHENGEAMIIHSQLNAVDAVTMPSSKVASEMPELLTLPELMDFLANVKVHVTGFDDDGSVLSECSTAGAEIIFDENYMGEIDYLIVPVDIMSMDGINIKAEHVVNYNWLKNSRALNHLSEISYFYEPIIFPDDLKPLSNLTVVFSIYSSDERNFLSRLAEILGADVHESYIKSERPILICPQPSSPKYNAAIKWHLPAVTRDWLTDCYKHKRRIPVKYYLLGDAISPANDVEEDEEHADIDVQLVYRELQQRDTATSNSSLDLSISLIDARADKIERTKEQTLKRTFWKEALGEDYEGPSQRYEEQSQSCSQFHDAEASWVSRSLAREGGGSELEDFRQLKRLTDFIESRRTEAIHPVQNKPLADSNTPESDAPNQSSNEQHGVGWHDPDDDVYSIPIAKPCFAISWTTSNPGDVQRNKLFDRIKLLNGTVCKNLDTYDDTCTHLLCEKPRRQQKILSCISAGKWILTMDYIDKSIDAGRFLNEEMFEFGNPKAAPNLPELEANSKEFEIAKAAYRWRKKIAMDPSVMGVFKGFRVILRTTKNASIGTLIEAGHGQVIDIDYSKPLNEQPNKLATATHVIFQSKLPTSFTGDEIKAIRQSNVVFVGMLYLNACITSETLPDPSDYAYN